MKTEKKIIATLVFSLFYLSGCSFNPFTTNNHTTGNPAGAVVGGVVGAGGIALLGGSKPLIALTGIGGGMLGYYVTTLRYASGGIYRAGGQVYQVGDFVGINIPSDNLFEPNTADFLPQAGPILDSAAVVLQRFPDNNILISGNTSGFSGRHWELKLSEKRAQKVSAYLWNAGINQFQDTSSSMRRLNYVGYGNYFPISSHDYTNDAIRENSRIQITSYPTGYDLGLTRRNVAVRNMGEFSDRATVETPPTNCGLKGEC